MFHYLQMISPSRLRHRGVPARLGSLVLLLQRSPLVKLLPEARVISTSGFTEGLSMAVTVIGGLGAFNAVSGVTHIAQDSPTANSSVVNAIGGSQLNFVFSVKEGPMATLSTFTISGALPAGLVHQDYKLSRFSVISGVPVETGSFPITITVWEFPSATGRNVSNAFTIVVAQPPAPAITVQPQGGNFTEGAFVNLIATQTSGFSFAWSKDGVPLAPASSVVVARTAPRRYRVHTTDPGATWRSGAAFDDTSWTPVSGGVGYDLLPNPDNFLPHIAAGGNVQSLMSNTGRTAVHIRVPFTMTGNTAISALKLRVQCDDGFVAWLNGVEVASQNRLGTLLWNSPAGNVAVDSQAVAFREIDISRSITALRAGENLLAIQAMNETTGSNDLLFNCELVGGTDSPHTRRLIIPAVQASHAGSYTLSITNPAGSVTSDPAVIVLPPFIATHPQSVSIASGETATLTVAAATSPPLTFQWYAGETGDTSQPVAGATNSSFTTPSLTQSTKYFVRVSNAAGSADSNTATVTVSVATAGTYTDWRNARFAPEDATNPAVSGPAADPDQDGVSNAEEYIFGTGPLTAEATFVPAGRIVLNQIEITFTAFRASGAGYTGRTRHYAIETTTDLRAGSWTVVPLFSDVIGDDQIVTWIMPPGSNRTFCRLKVWLTP